MGISCLGSNMQKVPQTPSATGSQERIFGRLRMRKWGEVTYTTRRHRTFAKVLLRWDEQREKLRDRFQLWRSAVFCASLFNDYRYKQLLGGVQVRSCALHWIGGCNDCP